MEIKSWGTRGSIAISNAESVGYGGNTTCFEIKSRCIPENIKLMNDAGTGLMPAAYHYMDEFNNGNKLKYIILFSHYHWDHIMGLTMAPPTFINQIPMQMFGPVDVGYGPEKMVNALFERPFFPVDDKSFRHKMKFKSLIDYDVHVLVVHPIGGIVSFALDRFNTYEQGSAHLPMGKKKSFPISECLVIKMTRTNHGNANCISYRYEERPTGKVMVFCSDHEDVAAISVGFRNHLKDADLLIMDSQYGRKRYITETAGYGHGTPYGCVKHAVACRVKKMGFTHHDPRSTDQFLTDTIIAESEAALEDVAKNESMLNDYGVEEIFLEKESIFLCTDYGEYTV